MPKPSQFALTKDSSLDILNQISLQAINEITLYGTESKSMYRIRRSGIVYNKYSEEQPDFNQWSVTKNIQSGTGQVLVAGGIWKHKMATSIEENMANFATANDAISALIEAAEEGLSAIGDKKSICAYIFDAETIDTESLEKDLHTIGWWIYGTGDYIDLETDILISGDEKDDFRKTLNLHFSMNLEERKAYFNLGDNLGDGFNSQISIPVEVFGNTNYSESILVKAMKSLYTSEINAFEELLEFSTKNDIVDAIVELAKRADALQQYLKLTKF